MFEVQKERPKRTGLSKVQKESVQTRKRGNLIGMEKEATSHLHDNIDTCHTPAGHLRVLRIFPDGYNNCVSLMHANNSTTANVREGPIHFRKFFSRA